jgi:hypothetical protein
MATGQSGASHPTLRVVTRELGDAVEIRVRDNGIGVLHSARHQCGGAANKSVPYPPLNASSRSGEHFSPFKRRVDSC